MVFQHPVLVFFFLLPFHNFVTAIRGVITCREKREMFLRCLLSCWLQIQEILWVQRTLNAPFLCSALNHKRTKKNEWLENARWTLKVLYGDELQIRAWAFCAEENFSQICQTQNRKLCPIIFSHFVRRNAQSRDR